MIFKNKTAFISGASRGIGKAIALKLASEGANIVVAAKSITENEKLGGTIYTAADEIKAAGGRALAIPCDIRFQEQIEQAVSEAVAHFGGIDILVNNASAIDLSNTGQIQPKRFSLMFDINVRGTFMVTQACLPHLQKSAHAHILTLSPPVNLNPKWLGAHVAYTISKYNMTMMAMGWAQEFKNIPIASNALWPKTTINTAAIKNLPGGEMLAKMSRTPQIVADAAFHILKKPPKACTGHSFIDEDILQQEGVQNFEKYAVTPGGKLYGDLFI